MKHDAAIEELEKLLVQLGIHEFHNKSMFDAAVIEGVRLAKERLERKNNDG